MNYRNLTSDTWNQAEISGDIVSGYKTIWLGINDYEESSLHIFKDEGGQFHYVIEVPNDENRNGLEDPKINGLDITSRQYRLDGKMVRYFIDIRCSIKAYLEEFTEVVKEISRNILEKGKSPFESVTNVMRNWKKFWANQNKQILSEDEQIGLICEIIFLEHLIKINPSNALTSWRGPFGQRHDFIFSDWTFEIKGSRRGGHIHTINGIDQLKSSDNKKLAFISFLVTESNSTNSLSLQALIEKIREITLNDRPDLIIQFNELLAGVGYTPINAEEYRAFKIDILDSAFYIVDSSFPTLTSDNLIVALGNRVTSVMYDISLDGLSKKNLNEINIGEYFY